MRSQSFAEKTLIHDFERAYDRALAIHEVAEPEGWAILFEAAKVFVASLNAEGWTFSAFHSDLSEDLKALGEVSMALAVAGQYAKDKKNPYYRRATALLKTVDGLGSIDADPHS